MTPGTFGLILLSVTISAMAQICLKLGNVLACHPEGDRLLGRRHFRRRCDQPRRCWAPGALRVGRRGLAGGAVAHQLTIAYPFVASSFLISAALAVSFWANP